MQLKVYVPGLVLDGRGASDLRDDVNLRLYVYVPQVVSCHGN